MLHQAFRALQRLFLRLFRRWHWVTHCSLFQAKQSKMENCDWGSWKFKRESVSHPLFLEVLSRVQWLKEIKRHTTTEDCIREWSQHKTRRWYGRLDALGITWGRPRSFSVMSHRMFFDVFGRKKMSHFSLSISHSRLTVCHWLEFSKVSLESRCSRIEDYKVRLCFASAMTLDSEAGFSLWNPDFGIKNRRVRDCNSLSSCNYSGCQCNYIKSSSSSAVIKGTHTIWVNLLVCFLCSDKHSCK